jgi:glutathione S-transferase
MDDTYALYYWPMLPGRAEVVRLILEDAQAPYRDVAREEGIPAVVAARAGELGRPRAYAPPVLVHGELVLSQSAVISRYLAGRHGLEPDDLAGKLHAEQHYLGWSDVMSEVHETHHPIATSQTYEEQQDHAKLRARRFLEDRLGPWLAHFERVVVDGNGTHVSGTVTYADFMARVVLRGIAYAFPRAFEQHRATIPTLLALAQHVEDRPNVRAYLESPRAIAFNEDGIFRHYPELDL